MGSFSLTVSVTVETNKPANLDWECYDIPSLGRMHQMYFSPDRCDSSVLNQQTAKLGNK